jgi:hypothetical protein
MWRGGGGHATSTDEAGGRGRRSATQERGRHQVLLAVASGGCGAGRVGRRAGWGGGPVGDGDGRNDHDAEGVRSDGVKNARSETNRCEKWRGLAKCDTAMAKSAILMAKLN